MKRNERSVTTLQDHIEAYEEYHWAKNLTATNLEPTISFKSNIQDLLKYKNIGMLLQNSPKTLDLDVAERTSIESESPFEAIEDRLSDDEKVNEIVLYLNSKVNISFSKRIADRIKFLFEAAKEEYPEEVAILPESIKNFVSFLQSEPNLKYPDVVLSPEKNICTQWRTAPNRHFSAEFLPTGDARFVIFSPDPKHPDKINRMSGIVSVDSLMQIAQPHGVLTWCSS